MPQCLNVLYSASDFYAPMAGISILSLLKNNNTFDRIKIYFISNQVSRNNINKIQETVKSEGHEIYIIDSNNLDSILESKNVPKFKGSYATFQKIFINGIADEKEENFVYIDSDTIINSDLGDLINSSKSNSPFSIVRVPMYYGYCKQVGIKHNIDDYPNCGVIVFNLPIWKKNNCENRVIEYLQKAGLRNFRAADQDVLSAALSEQMGILPPEYNVGSSWKFLGYDVFMKIHDADFNNFYTVEKIKAALKHPVIFHCMGGFYGRPWEEGNFHPFRDIWHCYKDLSLWKDENNIQRKIKSLDKIQKIIWNYFPKSIYITFHRILMRITCIQYKNSCRIR